MPYNSRARQARKPFLAYSSSSSRNNRRRSSSNHGLKKYIDPARFVQAASGQREEAYVPTHRFADFALDDRLHDNLMAKGYTNPSPIQDQAIPIALQGRDIIGIASTGTGKTAAFALPILNKLIASRDNRAIIIAPTRELAEQIEYECKALGKGTGLGGALLIGGTSMVNQLRTLKQNPQIVIGTPGRIKDHMRRGSLALSRFNIAVLDEVDRMLDMGFVNDVTEILKSTSPQRQSMFFSATMEQKVRDLIETFSNEPFTVSLKASSASGNVHQDVVRYTAGTDKLEKLHDLLLRADVAKVIVFDETQRNVEKLEKELVNRGFSAASLHGGKTQGQRKRALASFKNSDVSVLVATDVAARGIDVADITHVINYAIPNDYDAYIHRIGRAGRAGKIGYALTFIAA